MRAAAVTDGTPKSSVLTDPWRTGILPRAIPLFYWALAASLVVCAALFFAWSWRWPLVSDASAMHYSIFLMQHGWAPYRQLNDQQFPGAYAVEFIGMHVFGTGTVGWRLYDFALLGFATAGFFAVTSAANPRHDAAAARERSWMPGLFAACLFILIHGRDGLEQTGQRDFMMAVLLLGATAVLFTAVPRNAASLFAVFGFLSGVAASIKPTVLPLSLGQLAFSCYVLRQRRMSWSGHFAAATASYLVAPAACLIFLTREHALTAFLRGLQGIVPYYASLGHHSIGYILVHSVSPVLLMVYLWLALQVFNLLAGEKPSWGGHWQRTILLGSAAFALLDCILQARALPYYRYPLLAFLLPLMAVDFFGAVQRIHVRSHTASPFEKGAAVLAFASLAFGGFFVAPQSARLIHRYRWYETDFITSLQNNLARLGGASLSKHIQFLDSISGCPAVFYDLGLEPASGALDDYVLFGPDTVPIVQQTRNQFARDIFTRPPRVIVISSRLHLSNLEDFHKLERWPALVNFLSSRYELVTEWHPTRPYLWWSRPEWPASYRIYVLRDSAAPAAHDPQD